MLLSDFSPELLRKIVLGCDLKTLGQLAQVSKYFKSFLDANPDIWMQILARENDARYLQLLNKNPKIKAHEVSTPLIRLAKQYKGFFENKILINSSHLQYPQRRPWEIHATWVDGMLLLPNNRLASGSDKTVKIFDIEQGTPVFTLNGHKGWVRGLCLISENCLASASFDSTIRIWNLVTGVADRSLVGHKGIVRDILLLKKDLLATASDDKTIKIWNITTGRCIRTLCGHLSAVTKLLMTPDHELISASDDGSVRIWDINEGSYDRILFQHGHHVTTLLFLKEGCLASGSRDQTINICKISTGKNQELRLGQPVLNLLQLHDGRVAAACSDRSIKILDIKQQICLHTLVGHTRLINSVLVLPDNKLVSTSLDKTIKIWNPDTGQCILSKEFECWASPLAYANGILYAGFEDGSVRTFDFAQLSLDNFDVPSQPARNRRTCTLV